jgi:hypothetical protein
MMVSRDRRGFAGGMVSFGRCLYIQLPPAYFFYFFLNGIRYLSLDMWKMKI